MTFIQYLSGKFELFWREIQPGTIEFSIGNIGIYLNPHVNYQAMVLFANSLQTERIVDLLKTKSYPDLNIEYISPYPTNATTRVIGLRFPKSISTANDFFALLSKITKG